MSENGWTNNELGLEWLRIHFDPLTRKRQKGEYRLIILDGHDSHISHAAIQYAVEQKIILLCLPSHTTHMIQPLDVSLFQPLSTVYRTALTDFLDRARGYTVDKVDFLNLYLPARKKAFTDKNIRSAWRHAGLYPYQPNIVLNKWFPQYGPRDPSCERPITPPDASITIQGSNGDVVKLLLQTPADVTQVDKFVRLHKGDIRPTDFEKLGRACKLAIANKTLVEFDNQCLVAAAQRKKERNSRKKDHYGNARVLGQEHINIMKSAKDIESKKKLKTKQEKETEAAFGLCCKLFTIWETDGFKAIKQHDIQAARSLIEDDKVMHEQFKCFTMWAEPPKKSPTKSRSPKKQWRGPAPTSLPPSPSPSLLLPPRINALSIVLRIDPPPAPPNTVSDPTKQYEIAEVPGVRRSGRARRNNPYRMRI